MSGSNGRIGQQRSESHTVIAHFQLDFARLDRQIDPDILRLRMASRVVEQFLNYPENDVFQIRLKTTFAFLNCKLYLNRIMLVDVLNQTRDRQYKPLFIERCRAKGKKLRGVSPQPPHPE